MKILLGSKSPRRRELLSGLGVEYTTVSISHDEQYPQELQAGDIPLYIAKQKALAYRSRLHKDELLLTADTIVWHDGEMLGKPQDESEAFSMLRRLSGNTHQVYTAVCLTTVDDMSSFVDKTDVTFRQITDSEINEYILTCRPFDKAGAYGVQEWIGYACCTAINGSFYNVMGLPTEPLYRKLKAFLDK